MKRIFCSAGFFFLTGLYSLLAAGPGSVPATWLKAWHNPSLDDRPLKLNHQLDEHKVSVDSLRYFLERGMGGLVTNVAFDNRNLKPSYQKNVPRYLQSEKNWQTLLTAIKSCKSLGMKIWIYDEDGYPSGAAGGLVVQENPQYEATELAYDPARADSFIVRPAYEFTHASNNYYASRRYANLIDKAAMLTFIKSTHMAYHERLGAFFGNPIMAMFTDEPSLIAVNLGQIPEHVRVTVPLADSLDKKVKMLPCVPWVADLPQQYQARFGENILTAQRALFTGSSVQDRKTRRQFWSLIADLISARFFAPIQDWCTAHHIASSGHTLVEESLIHQVAVEGNALKCLSRMDIPGLDMLTSDPTAVLDRSWLTAGLPASAAYLNDRRRIMSEVSDHSQMINKKTQANLSEMQATAAWQAAWGVTEFTLYYNLESRTKQDMLAYGEFIGRLNTILKPAQMERTVLLYYPAYDLWEEYIPVARRLEPDSQSERAQKIINSFNKLGQEMQRRQIPFIIVDHEYLASAQVQKNGRLKIRNRLYDALVIPEGAKLPAEAAAVAQKMKKTGGLILQGQLQDKFVPRYRLDPPCENIVLGPFKRDGRTILLAVNVGNTPYQGRVLTGKPVAWNVLDPATKTVTSTGARTEAAPLQLQSLQTLMLIE
jgi:hypothetical protein